MVVVNILPARDYRMDETEQIFWKDRIAISKGRIFRDTYQIRTELVENRVISETYVASDSHVEIFPGDTIVISTIY
jgi:hypothetical protein